MREQNAVLTAMLFETNKRLRPINNTGTVATPVDISPKFLELSDLRADNAAIQAQLSVALFERHEHDGHLRRLLFEHHEHVGHLRRLLDTATNAAQASQEMIKEALYMARIAGGTPLSAIASKENHEACNKNDNNREHRGRLVVRGNDMTAKPDAAELTTPSFGLVIEVADSSSGPSMSDNTVTKIP
eukprot:13773030-Heterocapsa_arctica.AAC.1